MSACCLFVCFGFFLEPLENFFLNEDVAMAEEGVQIMTCAQHSWQYRFVVGILENAILNVTRI